MHLSSGVVYFFKLFMAFVGPVPSALSYFLFTRPSFVLYSNAGLLYNSFPQRPPKEGTQSSRSEATGEFVPVNAKHFTVTFKHVVPLSAASQGLRSIEIDLVVALSPLYRLFDKPIPLD
jgi:hypothetical protein